MKYNVYPNETGVWLGPPADDGVCNICWRGSIKDENRFLCVYPACGQAVLFYMSLIKNVYVDFHDLAIIDKFIWCKTIEEKLQI